jgi:death-on-curing family protein
MVWYPRRKLIEYVHDEQIMKYKGRLGFHRDPSLLTRMVAETRRFEGDIYTKAAFLLKQIITTHVFKDGNHRTAFVITEYFLNENGEAMRVTDYQEARTFLKDIRKHDLERIARWLKYGDS